MSKPFSAVAMAICLSAVGATAQGDLPMKHDRQTNVTFGAGGSGGEYAPFELFRGIRIFMKGTVNGRPVDILLDSGAERTILDKGLAHELGLTSRGTTEIPTATTTETVALYSGVTVSVGGFQLGNLTVWADDLASTGQQFGHPMQLILGGEAFKAALVDIDFEGHRIAFRDPAKFRIPAGFDKLPLHLGASEGIPTTTVSIDGHAPVSAIFDLGSASPLSISLAYEASERFLDNRRLTDTMAGGAGGLTVHDLAILPSIRLGNFEIHDVPTLFNRGATELPASGALLGMDVFDRFHVITDYRDGALYLMPNETALARPFPKDRSGLRVGFAGDRLQVAFVSKGSPAEHGGWKAGDTIVAIDGQKIGPDYPGSPLSQWKSGAAGTAFVLTLGDGTTRSLTLADYY